MDNTQNFLKSLFLGTGLALLSITFLAPDSLAFDQKHTLFTSQLQKFVKANGDIDYAKWKKDRAGLDKYLQELSELPEAEYKTFSKKEKRSLWLNAYNALAIKLVLDHYPIHGSIKNYPSNSIRQIPNTWDAVKYRIVGREASLYTIEHEYLRKAKDCRIHFAVTPASHGGAPLPRKAFNARSVDDELAKLTQQFMAKPENLSCDIEKGTITVSQIFKWFPLDFIDGTGPLPMPPPPDDDVVKTYVMNFLPPRSRKQLEGKDVHIIYAPYDWSLNDTNKSAESPRESAPDYL